MAVSHVWTRLILGHGDGKLVQEAYGPLKLLAQRLGFRFRPLGALDLVDGDGPRTHARQLRLPRGNGS